MIRFPFLMFIVIVIGSLNGDPGSSPADMCSLCIGHHGTCGCDWGHVVCCDGYDAYGCGCK